MSIDKLKQYDKLYELGISPISDSEYDTLKEEMQEKFPDDPYFNTVGSSVDSRKKVRLPFILGSLNKTKPDGSIEKWLSKQNNDIIITPKFDGVSIAVNWFKGKIVNAFLRGDGEYGMNITNKAKKFIGDIKTEKSIWARGEILLDHLPTEYKNKRNAVAGIINEENSKYLTKLSIKFYEYLNAESPLTEEQRLDALNSYGIPTTDYIKTNNVNTDYLIDILKNIKDQYSQFNIDGLVLTNNISERENTKYPDKKVAFKVNQEAIPTKIVKIEYNTSRTGRVVPLVHIEPVEIDGSTISKVTAHNIKYVIDNGLNINSEITIVKSGDVIPYIVDVIKSSEVDLPKTCASCGSSLIMKGVDLICNNDECDAISIKKLSHFLKTMGIMGISEATLENLNVNTIHQLYELTVNDIIKLDGFGIKKAESIYNELREKLITTPDKFLASVGIPGFGVTIAKLILENIKFVNFFETKSFTFIDGIGDVINNNIIKNMDKIFHNYVLLSIHGMRWKKIDNDFELHGKTFTLTGTAPIKRDDLIRILENKGCRVKSITRKTDYLVTNDSDSNSSKAKKAREYNIPFMSYDDLLKKLNIIEE